MAEKSNEHEKQNDSNKYAGSSKIRPNKNLKGGSGSYCCIPTCKSAFYDAKHIPTGISLFTVPSKNPARGRWLKILSIYRRKGGDDSFNKNKRLYVCEFHFQANEITVSLGIGRKKLKPGIVPTLFDFLKNDKVPRKPPLQRFDCPTESDSSSEWEEEEVVSDVNDEEEQLDNHNDHDFVLAALRSQIQLLEEEMTLLQITNSGLKNRIYSYSNIKNDITHFMSATGFDNETFLSMYQFLDPGKDCENMKMHDTAKRLSEETLTTTEKCNLKVGPKPKLSPVDQFFLYLSWLRKWF